MKRWIVVILIIALMVVGIIYYSYYNYGGVLDYGKQLSIYQILGNDIDISEYPELEKYKYKKANVKSLGSTVHMNIEIGNNEIIFMGNRNLVKINDVLYVYSE